MDALDEFTIKKYPAINVPNPAGTTFPAANVELQLLNRAIPMREPKLKSETMKPICESDAPEDRCTKTIRLPRVPAVTPIRL
jgi:hypothetical protein